MAALVLVAVAVAVFSRGLRGLAVEVTVVDDAVVGWLAGIDLPGFQAVMHGLAALSSWWVLNPVAYGLVLVLLVLRRFRHLIIWVVLAALLELIVADILGAIGRRPRPFGWSSRPAGAAGPCRRCRSPCSPLGWCRSCTRWCRRAAGATPASGW